jgi:polysaccharide deacetylase 2 family uncharacterized protein YibQ
MVLFGTLLFLAGIYLGQLMSKRQLPAAPGSSPRPDSGVPQTAVATSSRRPGPASGDQPVPGGVSTARRRVALVVDDLGRNVAVLDALARLGVPLSYSVLPFESRTSEVVARLRQRGLEILCHLPMEARNGADPGPGALTSHMGDRELVRQTQAALAAVPGAVGVNNHMGSLLSEDPRAMATILRVLRRRGLFFLDSRTSSDTVGYVLARSMGIPAAERRVFLDRDPSPTSIRHQFDRLLELARQEGQAVAIGHPRDTTLRVLQEELPKAMAAGYDFVSVSALMENGENDPLPGRSPPTR